MTHFDKIHRPWHFIGQEEEKEARPYLVSIQQHKDSDVDKQKHNRHKQRQE